MLWWPIRPAAHLLRTLHPEEPANLEIALDTDLFDRSSRFPVLTAEGETLLQEAKALYDRGLAFERHGDSLS